MEASRFFPLFQFSLRISSLSWIVRSGCRTDASEAAVILLPSNITVFTLDFSGSGLSGGEHVTLGWNEVSGLKVISSLLVFTYLILVPLYCSPEEIF